MSMEDSVFDIAIRDLKDTNQNELVGQLGKVFKAITQFDEDEVVSHYQAISFLGEVFPGGDGEMFITRIKEAISQQMQFVIDSKYFPSDYQPLVKRFSLVAGEKFAYRNA